MPREFFDDGHQGAIAAHSEANPDTDTLLTDTIRQKVHHRLLEMADGNVLIGDHLSPEGLALLNELIQEQLPENSQRLPIAAIQRALLNDIQGLGPLEALLADPDVSEIMVNSASQIYVERHGQLKQVPLAFDDDAHLLRIIERIVARVGRHIDEANPMCDARLPDGSRINAVIPPVALNGPCLTIRRFSRESLTIQDLIRSGSLSASMADFLECCVKSKLNLVISGGTGSGKTTLLNVLSCFIPANERIITIEDAAELQLQQPHVIRLETRQANSEGRGRIIQADLLRNTLRMRPDRILLGEVRGGEALAMLQAMNTGHEGSMTTVHANTCRDALSRLETMVLMAGLDLPHRAVREQIASTIDLVIQIERTADGTRRITGISEMVGLEGTVYLQQDIFRLETAPEALPQHTATGIIPKCLATLERRGLGAPLHLFQPE